MSSKQKESSLVHKRKASPSQRKESSLVNEKKAPLGNESKAIFCQTKFFLQPSYPSRWMSSKQKESSLVHKRKAFPSKQKESSLVNKRKALYDQTKIFFQTKLP